MEDADLREGENSAAYCTSIVHNTFHNLGKANKNIL